VKSDNSFPVAISSGEEDDCEICTCYSEKLINPDRKSEYWVEKVAKKYQVQES